MAKIKTTVVVTAKFPALRAFIKAASSGSHPEVKRVIKKWQARYSAFIRDRFDRFSKGGGDWKPLAPSTLRRRRKGKQGTNKAGGIVAMRKGGTLRDVSGRFVKAVNAAILKDTGMLFGSLSPTLTPPMLLSTGGFEVGIVFGGMMQQTHPSGEATYTQIAMYHQKGGATLPARPILVSPDAATAKAMRQDMAAGMKRLLKELGN